MSVRPIDMQTILPKSQEHRQSKDLTLSKPDNDQMIIHDKNKALSDARLRQVVKSERRDDSRVRDDGKNGKGGGAYPEAGTKVQEEEASSDLPDAGCQNGEDIAEHLSVANKQYVQNKTLKKHVFHRFDIKV